MCKNGQVDDSKEVGFPNMIPLVRITEACKYNSISSRQPDFLAAVSLFLEKRGFCFAIKESLSRG